jgi:hypothetical protein
MPLKYRSVQVTAGASEVVPVAAAAAPVAMERLDRKLAVQEPSARWPVAAEGESPALA